MKPGGPKRVRRYRAGPAARRRRGGAKSPPARSRHRTRWIERRPRCRDESPTFMPRLSANSRCRHPVAGRHSIARIRRIQSRRHRRPRAAWRRWHRRVAPTPWAIPTMVHRICAGALQNRRSASNELATLGSGMLQNPLSARKLALALKAANAEPQRPPLQACDCDIVDGLLCLKRGVISPLLGERLFAANSGNFLDVDIECVEKQRAVRRIRAAIAGAVVEQRMQRIEADALGAQIGPQARSGFPDR